MLLLRVRIAPILLMLGWALPGLSEARFLLELKHPSELGRVLNQHGLTLRHTAGATHIVAASDVVAPEQLLTTIRRDSAVREVELDQRTELVESDRASLTAPNPGALAAAAADRRLALFHGSLVRQVYLDQPAAVLIDREHAQSAYATGAGVVAVIDTGIDFTHPGLAGALVPGYDFIAGKPGFASDWGELSPGAAGALTQSTVALLDGGGKAAIVNQSTVALLDQSTVALLDGNLPRAFGHGTMVAGLIHLAAPTAKIMPLRVFRSDGSADLSDIVRAIHYAVDHGARVINMSFSLADASPELKNALEYAASRRVIAVASGGNTGRRATVYPAGYGDVVGVGSTTLDDRRSRFSNYGSSCTRTAAPGEALITLYPGNHYAAVWGTSFSAALVSGAVALMQQMYPNLERGKVLQAIEKGKEIEDLGLGEARLDLYKALRHLATKR